MNDISIFENDNGSNASEDSSVDRPRVDDFLSGPDVPGDPTLPPPHEPDRPDTGNAASGPEIYGWTWDGVDGESLITSAAGSGGDDVFVGDGTGEERASESVPTEDLPMNFEHINTYSIRDPETGYDSADSFLFVPQTLGGHLAGQDSPDLLLGRDGNDALSGNRDAGPNPERVDDLLIVNSGDGSDFLETTGSHIGFFDDVF